MTFPFVILHRCLQKKKKKGKASDKVRCVEELLPVWVTVNTVFYSDNLLTTRFLFNVPQKIGMQGKNCRKFLTLELASRRTVNYIILTVTLWLIEIKATVRHTLEVWGTQSKYCDIARGKRENVGENRMRTVTGTQSCLPACRRWLLSPVVRIGMDWYRDPTIPLIWPTICEVINYAAVHFLVCIKKWNR
jgi:hypothetical protein